MDDATPVDGWPGLGGLTRLDLRRADRGPESAWLRVVSAREFADLDAGHDRFLGPAERAEYAALRFERRRQSWLLGRYAAKCAAAAALGPGVDLATLEIARGVFGQPVLRYAHVDAPRLGISHAGDWAVGVAHPAGHPVAVDLEDVDPARRAVLARQLSEDELAWAASAPGGEAEPVLLTLLWTAREALSKALGCGLTVPFPLMETVERTAPGVRRFRGLFRRFGQYQFLAWAADSRVLTLALPRLTEVEAVAPPAG